MIIPVHMFAFADEGDRSKVRMVEIPIDPGKQDPVSSQDELSSLLELVFKYGQNDFQPKQFPSVSVGDVAEINGRYFMVIGTGWKKLTKEEFDGLRPPTSIMAYMEEIKNATKDSITEDQNLSDNEE